MPPRLVLALLLAPLSARAAVVAEVTRLYPVTAAGVVAPLSVDEVRRLVRSNPVVSVGGGRYSMGGQTATEEAVQLDMRRLDRVLDYSPKDRLITVEAGATWRKIQERIDPDGLSLKIMQSYANFTVGGSLSVNVHGRYVNQGPVIGAVRSIRLVLADGSLVEASRTKNPELFFGAIGGYGGLGVIVAATLELDENVRVQRRVDWLRVEDYKHYFFSSVRTSTAAVFHNGDIYPPDYETVAAVTFDKTDREPTVKDRLQPGGTKLLRRLCFGILMSLPYRRELRKWLDRRRPWGRPVEWRNYEASYDVVELEPLSRRRSTYVLQEYFIPAGRFDEFVPRMREVFSRRGADVLNVSIRHARKDPGSLMAWARQECFAFVVYYRQSTDPAARAEVEVWTRELIDAAVALGGAYYLPYQIAATDEQFHKAYPRAREWFALKKRVDPGYKFRNKLWDRYFPPLSKAERSRRDAVRERLAARKGYLRPEDQTLLTLPEWSIVFAADELASFLKQGRPSAFPYWACARQFWSMYKSVRGAAAELYPFNWGYHVMITTIGLSFSAEYAATGLYEKTLGRVFELFGTRTPEDDYLAGVARDYAAYIHDTPWYEFSFLSRVPGLWRAPGPWGLAAPRRFERRLFGTATLCAKSVWAEVIAKATGAAYSPEDLEISAWVDAGGADLARALPGSKVLEDLGGSWRLVSVPRYERFTAAVRALAKSRARFVEIAGNRRVMLTVLAPESWRDARLAGEVLGSWPVLSEPGRARTALVVPVGRLGAAAAELEKEGVTLEHVYDY